MKKLLLILAVAASSAALNFDKASAAAFTPGNLVVVQDGTGSGALTSAATAAFLDEFTTGGVPGQSIALPTAVSGANNILTLSGTSTSEGFLTLSANGAYLTVGGYNQPVGTASPNTLAGNRTAGRIDMLGNIDTSTILGDVSSIGNIRSVVSDTGTGFWVGSSSGGMRYTTLGTTTASTQLNSAAPTNLRVANIFSGQLYTSSASGTNQGVTSVGSGLPTTSGQTMTLLPGFPIAAGPSPYDYVFADANTLYVADDRATTGGGGLQKWTFGGSTWSLAYTLTNGLTAGLRGLTGVADGLGNEIFYATTADATTGTAGNKLVTITDLLSASILPGSEIYTTLATAGGNIAFRGVEIIPVPEPGTIALTGMGLLALAVFRRNRRN